MREKPGDLLSIQTLWIRNRNGIHVLSMGCKSLGLAPTQSSGRKHRGSQGGDEGTEHPPACCCLLSQQPACCCSPCLCPSSSLVAPGTCACPMPWDVAVTQLCRCWQLGKRLGDAGETSSFRCD